jgi:hypothetical protein
LCQLSSTPTDQKNVTSVRGVNNDSLTHICIISPVLQKIVCNITSTERLKYFQLHNLWKTCYIRNNGAMLICLISMRFTNLMKQSCFIILNISIFFGHIYAHLQEYRMYATACMFRTRCCSFPEESLRGLMHCVSVSRKQTYTQCARPRTDSSAPHHHLVLNTICSTIKLYS